MHIQWYMSYHHQTENQGKFRNVAILFLYNTQTDYLNTIFLKVKVKVKRSLYRPRQALRVPGGWGFQISWQSAHEGGMVVSPMYRLLPPPPPPEEIFLVLISVRGCVDSRAITRPEGLSMKNSSDTTGNRTRDLPVQCLNQLRHSVPNFVKCYA